MNRGDVVLVDFPYSDRSGSKLRPALVVQQDGINQIRDDTILAAITRTQRFPATEVLIDISTPEGQLTGLRHNSSVDCALLATFDQKLVRHRLGSLPDVLMQQVDQRLKAALGLR
jgi:mRNA interferase MazF